MISLVAYNPNNAGHPCRTPRWPPLNRRTRFEKFYRRKMHIYYVLYDAPGKRAWMLARIFFAPSTTLFSVGWRS
jgi:hypothetical protein